MRRGVRSPLITRRFLTPRCDVRRPPRRIRPGIGDIATARRRRPVIGNRSAGDRKSKVDRVVEEGLGVEKGAPKTRQAFVEKFVLLRGYFLEAFFAEISQESTVFRTSKKAQGIFFLENAAVFSLV